MECPQCRFENPVGAQKCQQCGIGLELGGLTTTGAGIPSGWSAPLSRTSAVNSITALAELRPGSMLAGRYEIQQLLGEGGMGAVYKALDTELDRVVAVKVIRPELAGRPEVLARFKQELILARQVTHRNVIRIFDLGQADGIRFITMEYVEGHDLKTLLKRQKFSPEEAAGIMGQVCLALEAAHAESVIHRDLKPPNVLVEENTGRVLVMDFGIARSMEQSGMTQTGVLVGTPEYMSPEQAKGEKLDTRSDLFPAGIIFYELLTGKQPYHSETAMGTLLKRVQEKAVPPIEVNPALPQTLNDIVVKCLAISPAERYQTAKDIWRDLELWKGPGVSSADAATLIAGAPPMGLSQVGATLVPPAPPMKPTPRLWERLPRSWRWVAAGAAAVLLAATALVWRDRAPATAPGPQKQLLVLVADFNNATGDPVFNGALEPIFITALEGASFINSYSRGEGRRVAEQLQPGTTKLDEPVARLVAMREGIHYIVAGSILPEGTGYRLSARAANTAGKVIATQEIEAANKQSVLVAVGKLAARIRIALGDDTPEPLQLAAAETFSAASLEAAQRYGMGVELNFAGKFDDAIRYFEQAVELDPNLGRAYSSLAVVHFNVGKRPEADKYFKLAMAKIDRMTDREKYRTRGVYYLMIRNHQKGIEEFNALLKQYPGDSGGLGNLAVGYLYGRDMPRALEAIRRQTQIYPKYLLARHNLAVMARNAGDFSAAAQEERAVLQVNPAYVRAYTVLAQAELAQGRKEQAIETYRQQQAVSARGASFAASGLADTALFDGRLSDAAAILDKAATADLANSMPEAAAKKFAVLAEANLALGRKAPALAAAGRAVHWGGKEVSVLVLAAHVYLQAGQEAKARDVATELGARLEPDPQAYAKWIEGEAQLNRGNAKQAIKLFQDAQKFADTWLGRLGLGRAYLKAGMFTEALSELELCLKRRGEVTEVFIDDVPTFWLLPPVYYYLGLSQDGLHSDGAAESYRTFLAIKAKANPDPMIADAQRRLAGR